MAKPKFQLAWADIALGAVVSLVIVAAFWMQWGEPLESRLYDLRAQMRATQQAGDEIIIIAIDDKSQNEIGKWPWPRHYMAEMVDQLTKAGVKTVGLNLLYTLPELNPGLEKVKQLEEAYKAKANDKAAQAFAADLNAAAADLDGDEKLAQAMFNADRVVLPMYFDISDAMGRSNREITPSVAGNFLPENAKPNGKETRGRDFSAPLGKFSDVAKSIGHINYTPSKDGVQRAYPMVIDYGGKLFPAFSLQVLRAYYNLGSEDYRYTPGKEIVLGNTRIPVDSDGRLLINYINKPSTDSKAFNIISFSDVRAGRVQNMEAFRDKIVLIGMVATGGGDLVATPVGSQFPGVEINATLMQNVISKRYLIRPEWAHTAELGILIAFALFVSFAIPHMKARTSAIIAAVLLIAFIGGTIYAFTSQGLWIQMLYPVGMLVVGYTVVVSKRYLVTEKRKDVLEGESAETNKMLGLSFQGMGQLDMAWEKFRKVPIDAGMKDTLYNLALDFERKRQFSKAVAVFEHIMTADKKFKDVEARADKLRTASETMVFGGGLGKKGSPEGTLMMDRGGINDLAKPTLGRYEVLKELGKGAMGVVYLGKDPKINREVAIKTLRFDDEFEQEDIKAMKERFFREAESAGRLVHPNIVTIYDAGDDGDISYIAMELLSGSDLKDYTQKGSLLPTSEVLKVVSLVADALDYAHTQGIVHRDIKPANIMRLKDGTIKVTDFGIARITSQSKTATGTVMGTPSYMAPEQLAGKKVDGRADLFSLGVTLYEMLTGEKPFTGESVATLMFRIANEPHPPIKNVRADVPAGAEAVIDKALQKNPDLRYQRGAEMAADLKALIARAAGAGL